MFKEQGKTALYDPVIAEAVETLSSIAELELDSPVGIAEKHDLSIADMPITFRSVHWLHKKNSEEVIRIVRGTFCTILDYLKEFYKRHVGHLVQHESIQDVNAIMGLVNDAAKKLDSFTKLIPQASVTDTKEFRELNAFYEKKIAPISAQESLSKTMKLLPVKAIIDHTKQEESNQKSASTRVFVDLESVKNDEAYELFFIRKEGGDRFFTPKLLRNLKIVSHVEDQLKDEAVEKEPLIILNSYLDMVAREHSKTLVGECKEVLTEFMKSAKRKYDDECYGYLYKAVLALFMASHELYPLKQTFPKGSSDYFTDFQRFLKKGIELAKQEMKGNDSIEKRLIRNLITAFYKSCETNKHILLPFLTDAIQKGKEGHPSKMRDTAKLSNMLHTDFEALNRGSESFRHVPVMRMLQALDDPEMNYFDPIQLKNWPERLFEIKINDRMIPVLRIPSPTTQEYINKAKINDEFLEFLMNCVEKKEKHLLFNLQNRTSWREFARSKEIEDLQVKEPYFKALSVVTMSKDTDFYNQTGPYQNLNQMDTFVEQLVEHMESEISGYSYPHNIKKELFPEYAKQLAHVVHDCFFSKKNVLPQQARMDFIEIYTLFLQLKIIEIVQPDSVSFTCKDAIDVGLTNAIEAFVGSKLIDGTNITSKEDEIIRAILFGLPFLYRGRSLQLHRFNRFISCIKILETEDAKAIQANLKQKS